MSDVQALQTRRESKTQVIRFVVTGFACVAIDLMIFFSIHSTGAIGVDFAKAISFLCGVAFGFLLNKHWTFRSGERSVAEPILYLALYLCTLAINVMVNRTALNQGSSTSLAFLIATSVTTLCNFLGMKLIVFRNGVRKRISPLSCTSN